MRCNFPIFVAIKELSGYRVKAGVLQLTVGISLIISMLCASMIVLAYYTKLSFLQQSIGFRLRGNAVSGIQYIMAHRQSLPFNEVTSRDLFGNETDSVDMIRKPWGFFEIAVATAHQGRHTTVKSAMLASPVDSLGASALYLPDNNAPVYLVGKTSITGTVHASARKFSTGYIDGKGYEGKVLVHGTVKKSQASLPEIDTTLLQALRPLMQGQQGAYRFLFSDRLPVNRDRSFNNAETLYYSSDQSIDLSDSISGNVIIRSAMKIRVTAEATLSDVILIAPDIDVDKEFTGNLQCIATRSITIGAGSRLKYPSALALLGGEADSTIVICKEASVEGLIIIPGIDRSLGSKGVFRIEEKASFHGMAYINGATDVQGSLWGHLTTRSTQAKVNTTVHGNHILNGEINAVKRSPYMPASLLWGHTRELVIARWIP